jgi:hypothetical protein
LAAHNAWSAWQDERVLPHDDFEVWYGFREAPIAPPDHCEYEIHLGPEEQGLILYRPDYPSAETPSWEYRFHWPQDRRGRLHRLMIEHGVLDSRNPIGPAPERPDCEQECLVARSGGRSFPIPWEEVGLLDPSVVGEIRDAVPAWVWEKLTERRSRYLAG